MKILLVEDDDDVRRLVSAGLEDGGHQVTVTADAEEGARMLEAFHFPVAIVDVQLPGIDGLELTRQIRARERYTYVIILTAACGREGHLRGLDAGADDFLSKPVDFDLLNARLRVAERVLGLMTHVRRLEGLLPICMECKAIRETSSDKWVRLEEYLSARSDAEFSHGYCDSCITDLRERRAR